MTRGCMEYKFEIHEEKVGYKRAVWSLKGSKGGVHIWAQFMPDNPFGDKCYGGVEVHYSNKPYDFSPDEAPIKDCWLIGGDCWCDGSSMYFEDYIKPMVESYEDNLDSLTEWVNSELLTWYNRTFKDCMDE